jgi:L-alanine-DL-glutamate epimerase and related enzymes of enolase superfamily
MMANEKPGGHGERSVSVGVLDMALWDALAKAKRVPLWKLWPTATTAEIRRQGVGLRAGGYYYPGKDLDGLQDEMKHYLDLGYSCVKMKVGGVPLPRTQAHRGGAEDRRRGDRLAVDVNGKFDLPTAIAFGKAIEPYGLRWYEEPLDPLDYLAHAPSPPSTPRRSPPARTFLHAGRAQPHPPRRARPDRDILQYDPRCPTAWSSTCARSTC